MKAIEAKYFEGSKRLIIHGDYWVLTARSRTRGHLPDILSRHGFNLRSAWAEVEKGIFTAKLIRK